MEAELVAESHRLSRELSHLTKNSLASETGMEAPMRIHSRDVDGGGLGAPAFHPEFIRYLGNTTVCDCGRPAKCAPNCHWEREHALGHLPECEPACRADNRFHRSSHRNHPNRMKRALRTIRRLNPKAYDLCYLVVALGYSFEDATAKLNRDNITRGLPERTPREYAVLWVSAGSMLAATY